MSFKLDYTLTHPPKGATIPDPPGYLTSKSAVTFNEKPSSEVVVRRTKQSSELKMKRAWDMALQPAKSLPMQGVMLYFSGSGIQIFSLGMIFMLLTGPISAVFNILKAFEPLRPTGVISAKDAKLGQPSYLPLIPPMAAYVACQGAVFALGLYKCSTMGLLPSGKGDWLPFETRGDPPEWSAIRASSLG